VVVSFMRSPWKATPFTYVSVQTSIDRRKRSKKISVTNKDIKFEIIITCYRCDFDPANTGISS